MADWFKFYENDLDETRLQYAVSKLPEVIPVWVGILSEACRDKSGTISWRDDEIELFGFSRRLGVSIPKVNEAINILIEIRYITKQDQTITILKWGKKQSEYCQKKKVADHKTGQNDSPKKDSVPTVSRQCPDNVLLEERRGEEIRVEEKEEKEGSSVEPNQRKASVCDADWLNSLCSNPAYTGIDVMREFGKMTSWCEVNRKLPSRRRFVNWLNRSERPMASALPKKSGRIAV